MSDSVPTDSVLRRHYEAALKMTQEEKTETPASSAEPAPAAGETAQVQSSGGFVDWLKRIFCG